MNLFRRELRYSIKPFCFWCLGMLFLVVCSAGKTTSMVGSDGASVQELLEQLPGSIQAVFGVGMVDYSTAIGVFAIIFTYISLIAAFHAVSMGVTAFAREERDHTTEFLYIKGMTRPAILTVKIIHGILQMLFLNVITYLVSVLSVIGILGENIAAGFLPMMTGMFFLQLAYYSAGLLISFLTERMKTAANISAGLVLVTFITGIASDFTENLEFLKYLSPFKYFDGKMIMRDGLSWGYACLCLIITVLGIVISDVLHNRRDLHC